uniref:Threonine/serine exporter-like N-terminal domain-containing protein n=1 Tax=Entomoneis paludosa TaxID=265537 RepID=A0A7S2YE62_9STRA|mmetsp:Transcript_29327/g.61357  ORF Transcript_29327/g.61357 Transcript_29327/m.61357 type:complete len:680 (+) Transcript_29327:194-2233(+)
MSSTSRPNLSTTNPAYGKSIRRVVSLREKKFDVKLLPVDLQRVFWNVEKEFGEDYALKVVFVIRTAVEIHRAWHMTLLTSKLLQQIKDRFGLRMTWELGVIKLKFRIEDGKYELHRKVPYDYDSEFQDLYMKIAVALIEDRINIHQALTFAYETKHGHHTAKSGLFLRDFPGRLVLYPLEAATCAVIFFSGDWYDAGVAAVCGLAAGLVEYLLVTIGGDAKALIDVLVGTMTGIIAGLFYRFGGEKTCLPAVFLGTLYWFFYGTAFVIGILEIATGELETGVVRFMAVSVKTFILSMGAAYGLMMTVENSLDGWLDQRQNCGNIDLDVHWWRIPLYLLCSASALGQYRFPIIHYWRGLAVQLVGYEVQYQIFKFVEDRHRDDFLDTAAANTIAAVTSVVFACGLCNVVDKLSYHYNARLLHRSDYKGEKTPIGDFMFKMSAGYVRLSNWIGLGRKSDLTFLQMEPKIRQQTAELKDPNHPRSEVQLTEEEEKILIEAVVSSENLNVWALLMPTVYQLVPGSLIARLWFNAIFPPPLIEEDQTLNIDGRNFSYRTFRPDVVQESVFQVLMVVATSLALGLLLGLGVVQILMFAWRTIFCSCKVCDPRSGDLSKSQHKRVERTEARRMDLQGVLNEVPEEDPSDDLGEEEDEESEKPEEIVNVDDKVPADEPVLADVPSRA